MEEEKHNHDTNEIGNRSCPLCGRLYRRCKENKFVDNGYIPKEFKDLPLYAADRKFCMKWDTLFVSWKTSYPNLDVMAEVRKAHSWEFSNEDHRKRNRPRFLQNWLSRQSDRPNGTGVRWIDQKLQNGHFQPSERELLVRQILGKDESSSRVGKTIPWRGHSYEIIPEGIYYSNGGLQKIFQWTSLTTADLKEILAATELYEHAADVF